MFTETLVRAAGAVGVGVVEPAEYPEGTVAPEGVACGVATVPEVVPCAAGGSDDSGEAGVGWDVDAEAGVVEFVF